MKYVILSLFWIFSIQLSWGQDIDIYRHEVNTNFHFPEVPRAMTFREFDLLSTQVRMQDVFASAIMPGYIHFRIYEKKKGYWLLGLRLLGYGGMIYLSARNKSWVNLLFNPLARYLDPYYKWDIAVVYASGFLILGTFFYDWLHGRYLLQYKQIKIRFKYAPVVGLHTFGAGNGAGITAGVRLQW